MFGMKKALNIYRHGNKFGVPRDVVAKLAQPDERTPDYAELQSRKHNLVFLYGNEMKGGRESFKGVEPLYTDVYTKDSYIMLKVREGEKATPVVLDPPDYHFVAGPIKRMPRAVVKGELFQLTAQEIATLDKLRVNGVQFKRIRVKIDVEHYTISEHAKEELRMSEPLYHSKRVHMYFGETEFFSFAKIDPKSISLFKQREHNDDYVSRYYYSPEDRG
jgi:hypothetical protein